MSIEFICEHCGETLRVEEYLGGQAIECYHCHGRVVIPQEGETAIIEFQCLSCGMKFRVPVGRAGSRTTCPECSAVLEVPLVEGTAAPPPLQTPDTRDVAPEVFEESAPAAPSPRIARHTPIGRPPIAPDAAQGAEESQDVLYVPPQQKVGVGVIFLLLGIAAAILIGVFVILKKQTPDPSKMPPLHARVKYDLARDALTITNAMGDPWHGVVITIRTRRGPYSFNVDKLAQRESVTIECGKFVGKGGEALDTTKTPGTDLIIMATCRDDVRRTEAVLTQRH